MFKQRGFTLIELMIGAVFCLVLISAVLGFVGASKNGDISIGINGVTELRCIDGYRFIVDQNGSARQVLDEFGKGAKCYGNPDPGKMGSFGSNR